METIAIFAISLLACCLIGTPAYFIISEMRDKRKIIRDSKYLYSLKKDKMTMFEALRYLKAAGPNQPAFIFHMNAIISYMWRNEMIEFKESKISYDLTETLIFTKHMCWQCGKHASVGCDECMYAECRKCYLGEQKNTKMYNSIVCDDCIMKIKT